MDPPSLSTDPSLGRERPWRVSGQMCYGDPWVLRELWGEARAWGAEEREAWRRWLRWRKADRERVARCEADLVPIDRRAAEAVAARNAPLVEHLHAERARIRNAADFDRLVLETEYLQAEGRRLLVEEPGASVAWRREGERRFLTKTGVHEFRERIAAETRRRRERLLAYSAFAGALTGLVAAFATYCARPVVHVPAPVVNLPAPIVLTAPIATTFPPPSTSLPPPTTSAATTSSTSTSSTSTVPAPSER